MKHLLLLMILAIAIRSSPLLAQNVAVGNITATSANCTTGSACVAMELDSEKGSAVIGITGTFVATVQFEGTANGTTYFAVQAMPIPSGAGVTSATSTGQWRVNVAGLVEVRVRASAYTSGTAVVTISRSSASASTGVQDQTCSGTQKVSAIVGGVATCAVDETTPGGSGITTLNTLNGATQTFTDPDDTNVTLAINSTGTNHAFTMGWTGALAKARQHAATAYTDQAMTFGAFRFDFQSSVLGPPRGTSLPGTCTVGDIFFDTDATAGQNWFGCTTTNNWTLQGDGGGGGGITSLEGQSGSSQTFADDTNVQIVSSGNVHTITWASTLAKARQHAATIYTDQANTYGAFRQDFQSAVLGPPRGTSLPGTCTVGDLFFDTDATAGQNWYGCTATNTWNLQGDGGGGGGISSLEGQTGGTQTFTDDTNIGIVSGSNAHVITWSGTLAKTRQHAATVYNDAGNTYSTGAQDFGSATSLKVPTSAGAAPTASGLVAYDSTANKFKGGANGTGKTFATEDQLLSFGSDDTTPVSNGSGFENKALPNGIVRYLTASNTFGAITITGTANEVSVANGDGLAGNPTLSLPATVDLGGKTSFEVPNSAAPTTDAFGEIAGDNNAWAASRGAPQWFDGTANVFLLGTLAADTPSNGQVPTWKTGGFIEWETPTGGADNYEESFSGVTSVTMTGAEHGVGHAKIGVQCYTNANPKVSIMPNSFSVDTSTFDVVVTFLVAQTGSCVVLR